MTFFELEKECKRRRKIKIALFSGLLLLILIIIFIIFLWINKTTEQFQKSDTNKTELKTKEVKKEVKEVKVNKMQKEKNNTAVLENKRVKSVENDVLEPVIDLNISFEKERIQKVKKIKSKKTEKNSTKLIITSNLPSFNTCINLAETYYKEGDYKKALKWAKNANLQNKKNPKSWIIVAKSLYKLGKKEKALKILKIYYNYTKDKNISNLIERIKNDEI